MLQIFKVITSILSSSECTIDSLHHKIWPISIIFQSYSSPYVKKMAAKGAATSFIYTTTPTSLQPTTIITNTASHVSITSFPFSFSDPEGTLAVGMIRKHIKACCKDAFSASYHRAIFQNVNKRWLEYKIHNLLFKYQPWNRTTLQFETKIEPVRIYSYSKTYYLFEYL